jgi:hypothetical protein
MESHFRLKHWMVIGSRYTHIVLSLRNSTDIRIWLGTPWLIPASLGWHDHVFHLKCSVVGSHRVGFADSTSYRTQLRCCSSSVFCLSEVERWHISQCSKLTINCRIQKEPLSFVSRTRSNKFCLAFVAWVTTSCVRQVTTNVSEEHTASIYMYTWYHNQEDHIVNYCRL